MISYKKLTGEFLEGKKKIKHTSKDFLDTCVRYAIQMVAEGGSLSDFPKDEKVPYLYQIFEEIEKNPKHKAEMGKAEAARLSVVKEHLLKSAEMFRKDPSAENKDSLIALEKVHSSLAKQAKDSGLVQIIYNSPFPEDFWSRLDSLKPEAERTKEELEEGYEPDLT